MKATCKSHLLVAALLLLVAGIFTSPRCKAQPYREYYELIGEAFDHIVNADYQMALQIYKKAFAKFSKHPAGVKEAINCALLLGDTEFALQCMREQILSGRSLEAIKKDHQHRYFTEDIQRQIEKEYPALRGEYAAQVDSSLYSLLTEAQREDQIFAVRLNNADVEDIAAYTKRRYSSDSVVLVNSKLLHRIITMQDYQRAPMFGITPFPIILMVHHFQVLGQLEQGARPPKYFDDDKVQQLYAELKEYDMRLLMVQMLHNGEISASSVRSMFELGDGVVLSGFVPAQIDLQDRKISMVPPPLRITSISESDLLLHGQQKLFDQQLALHSYLSQEQFPFDEAIAFCKQHGLYEGEADVNAWNKEKKWKEFEHRLARQFLGDDDPRISVFRIDAPFHRIIFPKRKQ